MVIPLIRVAQLRYREAPRMGLNSTPERINCPRTVVDSPQTVTGPKGICQLSLEISAAVLLTVRFGAAFKVAEGHFADLQQTHLSFSPVDWTGEGVAGERGQPVARFV